MFRERRKHQRIPIDVPLRISVKDLNRFSEEQSVDLSAGGVFYRTPSPPPVGTELDLEFHFPEQRRTIRARGIVVRIVPRLRELRVPPGAGIQFTEIDEVGKRFIELLVQKYNRNHPWRPINVPRSLSIALGEAAFDDRETQTRLLARLSDEELRKVLLDTAFYSQGIRDQARDLLRSRGAATVP